MHEITATAMSDVAAQRIGERHDRARQQRLARSAKPRRDGPLPSPWGLRRGASALAAGALAAVALLAGCSETPPAAHEPAEAGPVEAAAPGTETTSGNEIYHCRVGPEHQPC